MAARIKKGSAEAQCRIQQADEKAIEQAFNEMMDMIEKSGKSINVEDLQEEYNIRGFNIDKLQIKDIRDLHKDIIEKYKIKKLKRNWCENELKLFVWLLFHYELACQTKLSKFTCENWEIISSVFVNKSIEDCKFQWLSLLKIGPPNEEWTQDEDNLLLSIIEKQQSDNKWNDVAKELYRNSEQQFFRRPKQCRERWRNYLDPNIEKGQWTQEEDATLLEYVLEIGKKWSAISKCMKSRTEHSVKNRFKSLIKRFKKDHPRNSKRGKASDSQSEVIKNILKQFEHSEDESAESIVPELPPKKVEKAPKKKKVTPPAPTPSPAALPEKPKEQLKKAPPPLTVPTPFAECIREDFNAASERQWIYSPITPFSYLDKNKQFGSLIFVASPRVLSPRFRNLTDWDDPDYYQ